ncbi:hypothetical protein E4U09_001862 [Claviceps aff. purpurea]|uniref:Uncharacterized protein n=1 Tax=Claviceps aff. purpurea TaxID=1967640 RepID=A0A9P7U6A0_9HYPO|nr:hypothetical protein E4U09_001862 [Claviceps aff. purpurea]
MSSNRRSHDEVANGHSAGPQQSPQGTVTTGGGIPNGPNGQVCSMQDTTTLFVTVYPTTPNPNGEGSSAEATGPDGTVYTTVYPTRTVEVSPVNSAPGDNPSAQVFTTLTVTDLWVGSSASVSSPVSPVSGSDSSVITTGSVSDGASNAAPTYESAISLSQSKPVESTSAVDAAETSAGATNSVVYSSGSQPVESTSAVDAVETSAGATISVVYSSESQPVESTSAVDAVGTSAGATNSAVTYSASDNFHTATVTQGTANANGDGEIFTTVTDTVVEWATGSDGSSPVTVLSAHTMTVAPSGVQATSGFSPLITCWTVTGSDGKETVVESTVVTNQDNSGIQSPTTFATVTSGSLGAQSVTSNLPQQTPVTTITAGGSVPVYTGTGMTTATVITILGNDGVPTVVHSTWVLQTGPVTAAASGVLPVESTISTQEAQGHDVTSQTTYTVVGPDGRPTVVESILVIPVSVVLATELPQNLPNGITVQATPSSVPGATVTCSSYTLLGSDGKLTVVETTYLVSGPTGTSGVSGISPGVVTGIPSQITAGPSQVVPAQVSPQALTTCITYTVIGTDGLSTVVESTIAMPSSNLVPTGSVFELPSAVSPTLTNALPQGTQLNPQGGQPIVTCITVDVVGPNGIVTPVVETIVLTAPASVQVSAALPAATIGLPSVVSQIVSDLPQGVTTSSTAAIPMTTTLTIPVVGSDGATSSLVQTVVYNFPDPSSGFHPFTAGEVPGAGSPISSSLQAYGSGVSSVLTALPPPPPVALTATSGMLPAGTNVVPSIPVLTVVTGLDGMTGLSVVTAIPATAYNNPANSGVNGLPASQLSASLNPNNYAFSQQAAVTAFLPQTSTWVNVIPEPTTTRTLKFPLTTLTTVFVPAKASVAKRGVLRRARQAILPP